MVIALVLTQNTTNCTVYVLYVLLEHFDGLVCIQLEIFKGINFRKFQILRNFSENMNAKVDIQ